MMPQTSNYNTVWIETPFWAAHLVTLVTSATAAHPMGHLPTVITSTEVFLARTVAWHALITSPSYSTSFDNEAGRCLRRKGLAPRFGCKVQEEERSQEGQQGQDRWCDAAASCFQLAPIQPQPDSLLRLEKRGDPAARLCASVHVWARRLRIAALVCLSLLFPPIPPRHQNSGREDGPCQRWRRLMKADKVGQESTTRMLCSWASGMWVSLCVNMWDCFRIPLGLSRFGIVKYMNKKMCEAKENSTKDA